MLTLACSRQAAAQAGVLTSSVAGEHERAAGAWHAEWPALTAALAATGGAAASSAVDSRRAPRRCRAHASQPRRRDAVRGGGAPLGEKIGRGRAEDLLAEGRPLREVLAEHLPPDEVDAALDPTAYLGSAGLFVDRALELYRGEPGAA